ncbi:MAG: riboflavin biosynthesis protein RibF [Erysipelotrichales bacterium]|nr:riboflavin biosynthesis protein RibF [Erysipelotrichales bacterium]
MEIRLISLGSVERIESGIVACIGYFDGFHKGHQSLFNATLHNAKVKNLQSAIITFDPDPWVTIKGIDRKEVPHISTMEDRQRWAEDMGFDYFLMLDFTKEMATLSPSEFLESIIRPLHVNYLVCGYDFHFGYKGSGNVETLRQADLFEVEEIEEIQYLEEKISSTRITNAIIHGNMELTHVLLGRPYTLHGKVIHGRKKGREIGFPTANIQLEGNYIVPKVGVYLGKIQVHNYTYITVISFGYNPTFNHQDHVSIEAHILDFQEKIYDESITLEIYQYIRNEQKFETIQQLQQAITQDCIIARSYFKEN